MGLEYTEAQKAVLLAETLGDVGKLHDAVQAVGNEFTGLRTAIVAATEDAIRRIGEVADAQHEAAGARVADSYARTLRAVIEGAVAEPVQAAALQLKEQTALATSAHQTLQRQLHDTLARFWLPIGGLAAVFVLAFGCGMLLFWTFIRPVGFLSDAQKSALVTGERLQAAWPHLDTATQQRINAAIDASEKR